MKKHIALLILLTVNSLALWLGDARARPEQIFAALATEPARTQARQPAPAAEGAIDLSEGVEFRLEGKQDYVQSGRPDDELRVTGTVFSKYDRPISMVYEDNGVQRCQELAPRAEVNMTILVKQSQLAHWVFPNLADRAVVLCVILRTTQPASSSACAVLLEFQPSSQPSTEILPRSGKVMPIVWYPLSFDAMLAREPPRPPQPDDGAQTPKPAGRAYVDAYLARCRWISLLGQVHDNRTLPLLLQILKDNYCIESNKHTEKEESTQAARMALRLLTGQCAAGAGNPPHMLSAAEIQADFERKFADAKKEQTLHGWRFESGRWQFDTKRLTKVAAAPDAGKFPLLIEAAKTELTICKTTAPGSSGKSTCQYYVTIRFSPRSASSFDPSTLEVNISDGPWQHLPGPDYLRLFAPGNRQPVVVDTEAGVISVAFNRELDGVYVVPPAGKSSAPPNILKASLSITAPVPGVGVRHSTTTAVSATVSIPIPAPK